MKASICCFKSLHSNVSWSWSRWKRQYLSLDLLLGPPFNLSGNVKAPSSLIYISYWSIGVFKGVKFVNLPVKGLDCLSFLPSFNPYPAELPPASLSSWASPHRLTAHLQHSCTWWSCKVRPTWFLGHSCTMRIETYPFVKAATSILSSASSIESTSLLKWAI